MKFLDWGEKRLNQSNSYFQSNFVNLRICYFKIELVNIGAFPSIEK